MAKFNTQQNGSIGLMESSGNIPGGSGVPGPQGPAGPKGEKGDDGFSPTISVQNVVGGHTLTITDVSGTKTVNVMNGADGDTGPAGPKGEKGDTGDRGAQGDPGLPGEIGPQGPDGPKGNDGFSPTVEVTDIDGGHQVTITDVNGPHTFIVKNGKDGVGEEGSGEPGEAAGFGEVTATVDDNVGIPEVTVTTSGPNTAKNFNFEFKNIKGEKGETGDEGSEGPTGPKGEKGEPGYSPTIEVEDGEGEHTVTITDAEGPHEFTVHDGEKGDKGDPGSPVAEISGLYGFNVTDEGHLVVGYTGEEPPPFKLEDGHLIAEMPHEMDLGDVTGPRGPQGPAGSMADVYSTNEIVIGTWIDGKPLYRISGETTTSDTLKQWVDVPLKIKDVSQIVSVEGCYNPMGVRWITLPHIATSDSTLGLELSYLMDRGLVMFVGQSNYSNKKLFYSVKYTKTTD